MRQLTLLVQNARNFHKPFSKATFAKKVKQLKSLKYFGEHGVTNNLLNVNIQTYMT